MPFYRKLTEYCAKKIFNPDNLILLPLLERFNNFTDEIEGLKNGYKEKNMKLYNLVL